MKKHLVFAAMIAVIAASCAKEQFVPSEFNGNTITRITVASQDTKLALGELKEGNKRPLLWEKGDQIAANGVASDKLVDSLITDEGASATFMFRDAIIAPLEIIYPASAYKAETSVELPDNPSYKKPNVVLMGKSASVSETATLKSAVAIIKTVITKGDENDPITTVSVSSATAQLRGIFTPDYENATLTSTTDEEEFRTITQTIGKGIAADAPLEVYTVIPAGTYDITVKVANSGGKYMEKALNGKTFEAGKIYNLPETKFEPTGTGEVKEITSADDWNEFALAFNENPEDNMKPVEITGDLDFLGKEVVSLGTVTEPFPLAINGNGNKVSNIADGTASLVGNLGGTGILKNLTIDEDCNYVVNTEAPDSLIAPFVRILNGTVENCENKAAIVFDGFTNTAGNVYIAGIAANIETKSTARIINCRNSGSITVGDGITDGVSRTISSKRFAVGGIAGYGAATEIRDCENRGALSCNYFLNGYCSGGISGAVTANYYNCTNIGDITKANGSAAKNRSEYLAGINAYSWTDDSKYYDCSNIGNITTSGAFKTTYIAGITAYNTKTVDLQRCSNYGDLKATNRKLTYYTTVIGGLVAYAKYAQTIDLTGCIVDGELALTITDGTAGDKNDQVAIGGVVGLCGEGINIVGNGFTTTPNIHVTFPKGKKGPVSSDYFGIGAIVGVNREVNAGTTGKVTISDCRITGGKVQIDNMNKSDQQFRYNNLAVGGILGLNSVGGVEISGCEVGNVTVGISPSGRNTGSTTSEANLAVGGIAGRVVGGVSSISDCEFQNTSSLYANVYISVNETQEGLTTGGIIGEVAATADADTMTISGCTVGLKIGRFDRAMVGGIAGKAKNTTIENCSVDLGSATFDQARSSAGIVGMITDGTVTGCTVNAPATKAIYCSYTSSTHEFAGGIAAVANNTAFTNCKSFANVCANKLPNTSNARNEGCAIGGFVAKALNGCTFTNCKCGGTLCDTQGGVIREDTPAGTTITLSDSKVNDYAIQFLDGCDAPAFTYWNGE